MTPFLWVWWRLAWGQSQPFTHDGNGTWVRLFSQLNFLRHRRCNHPLGKQTLYQQVYHHAVLQGEYHTSAVDLAITAVEFFGNHRALSQHQLDDYYDQIKEAINEPAVY